MILLRRFGAVLLAVLLAATFLLALAVSRVNATVIEAASSSSAVPRPTRGGSPPAA